MHLKLSKQNGTSLIKLISDKSKRLVEDNIYIKGTFRSWWNRIVLCKMYYAQKPMLKNKIELFAVRLFTKNVLLCLNSAASDMTARNRSLFDMIFTHLYIFVDSLCLIRKQTESIRSKSYSVRHDSESSRDLCLCVLNFPLRSSLWDPLHFDAIQQCRLLLYHLPPPNYLLLFGSPADIFEFFSGNSGNSAISIKGEGLANIKMCVERNVFSKG